MIQAQGVRTDLFRMGEPLVPWLLKHIRNSPGEGQVLAISSKIVSLAESRSVPKSSISKIDLILRECDTDLGDVGYGCRLTATHGHLLVAAGIDESNSESEQYLLHPEDPFRSAHEIWRELRNTFGLTQFGLILTDSRTTPLRRGVQGIALSHAGFVGVRDRVGERDLFGRELKMTQIALADALAVAAVLEMGEVAEQTPIAWVKPPDWIQFVEDSDPELRRSEVAYPLEQDLYRPMLLRL